MEPISSSLEDYLEAIALIIRDNRHAHAKDIADRLKVKMPSVTNALQSLAARGLIRYQPHAPVTLTAEGTEKAAVIRQRHAALRSFFRNILMLDEAEADDAACRIEHILRQRAVSRFVALAEAIESRDDCALLRTYLNDLMPQLNADAAEDLISLDELPADHQGIVVRVAENLRGIKKFADLGLVHGTLVRMEGRAPFGDLLRVRVMGSSLSLRKGDAAYIWVRPMSGGMPV